MRDINSDPDINLKETFPRKAFVFTKPRQTYKRPSVNRQLNGQLRPPVENGSP